MSSTPVSERKVQSEATPPAVGTTVAATVGLTFGPSVIAILAFGIFIRPIEAEFGWSRLQVSLAATIVAYMAMLVAPLQGVLIDRFGTRVVVLVSIPFFALGLALFYLQPANLTAFYLFWALLPVLATGLWPVGYLRVVSGWFERRLGLALGLANAGIGIGSVLVPLIASMLIQQYGWRTAYVGLGIIVLVVTWPVAFFFLQESPREKTARNQSSGAPELGLSFRESIRRPVFLWLLAAYFLLGITSTALVTQQVPMLMDAGWTPERAALVQAIFGVGLMAGRIGIGYVIDHIFAPFVMASVAVGGAIGCVLYATVPGGGWAFASACLIGLVVGAEFDVLAYVTNRYFGTVSFGKLYGVVYATFQLASGLGVAALSFSRSQLGTYTAGFTMFAVILLLSAFTFTRLGPFTYRIGSRD